MLVRAYVPRGSPKPRFTPCPVKTPSIGHLYCPTGWKVATSRTKYTSPYASKRQTPLPPLFARERKQRCIAREIRNRELRQAALAGSQELSGTPQFKVPFRDHETVGTLLHHRKPVRGVLGFGVAGDEKAVAGG